MVLQRQHAGQSFWEKLISDVEVFLMNRTWTVNTTITPVEHLSLHRQWFIEMLEASAHVIHQMPMERTRVKFVLESLQSKDPVLLAAISSITMDDRGMFDRYGCIPFSS